jgi:hypothetical protein
MPVFAAEDQLDGRVEKFQSWMLLETKISCFVTHINHLLPIGGLSLHSVPWYLVQPACIPRQYLLSSTRLAV